MQGQALQVVRRLDLLGGEEGGRSMSNPVNRDTLIAYIEEKSGMNVPGWLQEVIMSCPAAVDALEEAYENGKRDAEPKWIPCSECKRRCEKWDHFKI